MDRNRSSLGFADELDDLDTEDWATPASEPSESKSAASSSSAPVLEAAAASGFYSREAPVAPPPVKRPIRRRRTGRNAQFNIKTRPETIAAFTRIADDRDWGLGETLEHAVALLEKAYPPK